MSVQRWPWVIAFALVAVAPTEKGQPFQAFECSAEICRGRVGDVQLEVRGSELRIWPGSGATSIGLATIGDAVGEMKTDGSTVTLERAPMREKLTLSSVGVEQSWIFDAPPPSRDGRYEVRVRVDAELVASRSDGLHFRTNDVGIVYGNGTWIDATGRRSPVAARWIEGEIVLEVPAGVVRSSTFPAILDPTISAEVPLDAPVVTSMPATAPIQAFFDGTNDLAEWTGNTGAARRLAPTGVAIDTFPFFVPGQVPILAFNGTEYLDVHFEPGTAKPGLLATRLSTSGTILDASPVTIDPTVAASTMLGTWAAGSNGSDFIVAWIDSTNTMNVATVSGAGVVGPIVKPTNPLTGAPFKNLATLSNVIWDGVGYLVGTTPNPPTPPSPPTDFATVARLDTAGACTGATLLNAKVLAPGPSDDLALTLTGGTLSYGRMDPSTLVTSTTGTVATGVSGAAAARFSTGFTIAYSSSGTGGVHFRRANDSAALGPDVLVTSTSAAVGAVAIAASSSNVLIEYLANGASGKVLFGQRVDATTVLDTAPILLSTTPNLETAVAVADDGAQWSFVWMDQRDTAGATGFRAVHASYAGVVSESTSFSISSGTDPTLVPSVAGAGGTSVIAWYEPASASINARRSLVGSSPDPAPMSLGSAGDTPAVACTSADCLVVWPAVGTSALFGGRVRLSDGTLLDPGGVDLDDAPVTHVRIAHASSQYLVVWNNHDLTTRKVYAARISDSAVPIDISPLAVTPAPGAVTAPFVASNGTDFLVVATVSGASGLSVVAVRVSGTGSILDTPPIAIGGAPSVREDVRVIYDGTEYVVGWREGDTLKLARVTSAGVVLDPGGVDAFAATTLDTIDLAASPSDGFVVGYNRFSPEYVSMFTSGPPRAYFRAATFAGGADAGAEAGVDAALDAASDADAGVDAASDADALPDTVPDVTAEADSSSGADASLDAVADSASDATRDAPADASAHDATTDSSADALDDGATSATSGGASGCGCSTTATGDGGALSAALFAVGLLIRRRRRARVRW